MPVTQTWEYTIQCDQPDCLWDSRVALNEDEGANLPYNAKPQDVRDYAIEHLGWEQGSPDEGKPLTCPDCLDMKKDA